LPSAAFFGLIPSAMPDELDELERRFHRGDVLVAGPAGSDGAGTSAPAADGGPASESERASLRTTELGRRLARRRGYALAAGEPKPRRLFSSWGLGGLLLVGLWSLVGSLPALGYWLSRTPPIDLGHLGAYHLEAARDGAYAKVQGIASPKRGTYSRFLAEHELFPLIASRILVDRARPADDSLRGFGFQFNGEGRLHRAEAGGRWEHVREQFVQAGELARQGDLWVLEEGASPGKGFAAPLESGLWLLLCCAPALVLLRRLRARIR
jgi:hypothetical protein